MARPVERAGQLDQSRPFQDAVHAGLGQVRMIAVAHALFLGALGEFGVEPSHGGEMKAAQKALRRQGKA
jgi:hypothetical protein